MQSLSVLAVLGCVLLYNCLRPDLRWRCCPRFFQRDHIPLRHREALLQHSVMSPKITGTGICTIRLKVLTTWAIKMRSSSCAARLMKWCTSWSILVCHSTDWRMGRFISAPLVVNLRISAVHRPRGPVLLRIEPVMRCCIRSISVTCALILSFLLNGWAWISSVMNRVMCWA